MKIIAYIVLLFSLLAILLYPLIIGKEKKGKYDYYGFIARIIEFVLLLAVCGRVIGWF